jgi:hypothetical protein
MIPIRWVKRKGEKTLQFYRNSEYVRIVNGTPTWGEWVDVPTVDESHEIPKSEGNNGQ